MPRVFHSLSVSVQLLILTSSGGSTVVWFDGPYRYELFGRSFVPIGILREMSDDMVPLASIEAQSS